MSRVACGVTSRAERPVPPVVSTRSAAPVSARRLRFQAMSSRSSGRIVCSTTTAPASRRSTPSTTAGPLLSARSPWYDRSEIVRIATRTAPSAADLAHVAGMQGQRRLVHADEHGVALFLDRGRARHEGAQLLVARSRAHRLQEIHVRVPEEAALEEPVLGE